MTGSFGLDVDDWQGCFYDDDLPADWRAASYSTLLRSVLLPAQEWQKAVEQNWVDEVDKDFRFVLYAHAQNEDALSGLINKLQSLPDNFSAQVAGVVLQIQPELAIHFDQTEIAKLQQLFPLCLDVGPTVSSGSELEKVCLSVGAAAVWYPASQPAPMPAGDLLVTLIDQEALPEQKGIVSKIEDWMSGPRRAGLFNVNKKDAPVRAEETRILAELMGV